MVWVRQRSFDSTSADSFLISVGGHGGISGQAEFGVVPGLI
jgi:hypothetical protein